MKPAVYLLVVLLLVKTIVAWVGIIPPKETDPENKGHCYTTSYNIGALAVGEKKSVDGQCMEALCAGNKYIHISGCGSVSAEPPCFVTKEDLTKPYPQCCPTVSCPEDNTV